MSTRTLPLEPSDRGYRQGDGGTLSPADYRSLQEEGRQVEESLVRRNAELERENAALRRLHNIDTEKLGRVLYAAFVRTTGHGEFARPWEELLPAVREQWGAIAKAVVEAARR